MADTSGKPPGGGVYDADFLAWTEQQARAIEENRWSDVDAANVADEIASLGHQLVQEARQRIEILISYLLKWRYLGEYRGQAWQENISRQRQEISELMTSSARLRSREAQLVVESYEEARRRLRYETYFFETDFPASCPFTITQVFDTFYFPEELDAPAVDAFPTARRIA